MAHEPSDTLKNRSFVGLIVAQFLAGFNDQFIHAAAMFYAIRMAILNEAQAISLMPILFYAPWAIFCTIAGYLADRFSKRWAIVIWKVAEVVIAVVALLGFYLGAVHSLGLGAWIVMATVFLMGTHAAFFAPAKYGAMPEILQAHALSKGNGILESTTFLAAILGTVAGGLLSHHFAGREYWIGVVLLGLALFGAVASLVIAYLPPANPGRLFPKNLFKPLFDNLGVLMRSRPLALAVLGIAFFIFMVAYMRATMYMHGETRNPKWDEFKTSLVVATVALGVGLGSPLAGFLSGGKVELGLVPLACVGMTFGTLFAAFAMNATGLLVTGLIIIGFFSGFYMVPLYTLLQHRAPKTSKGDLVATSNFINVMGAMAASVLFFVLVQAARLLDITPAIQQEEQFATGKLVGEVKLNPRTHRPEEIVIKPPVGRERTFQTKPLKEAARPVEPDPSVLKSEDWLDIVLNYATALEEYSQVVEFQDDALEGISGLKDGDEVAISRYEVRGVVYLRFRLAGRPAQTVYDNEALPRYLFFGAAFMTLCILALLLRKLPDFFLRTAFWARCLGRYRIKVVGMHNLPTSGPVILATNCDQLDNALQVLAATDRYTHFILVEAPAKSQARPLLRYLAARAGFTTIPADAEGDWQWQAAAAHAAKGLRQHDLVAVTVDSSAAGPGLDGHLAELPWQDATVIPAFCGADRQSDRRRSQRIRVVFGQPVPPNTSLDELRQTIRGLGEWLHQVEAAGIVPQTIMIPPSPRTQPQ